MQLTPNSFGSFREMNDCHNPGGPAGGQFCSGERVGATHGRQWKDKAAPNRLPNRLPKGFSSRWYSFPASGQGYTATKVVSVPVESLPEKLGMGWKSDVEALTKFLGPEIVHKSGYLTVYRIGSKEGGLEGRNAGNLLGLTGFISDLTDGGEYKLSFAAKGRHLSVYHVKLTRPHGEYAASRNYSYYQSLKTGQPRRAS